MFTGIVEMTVEVLEFASRGDVHQLVIARPAEFDDVKTGDSICVNGVCLTVVKAGIDRLFFDVGDETKKITNWKFQTHDIVNVERSMKLSDRVHGHFVSGHVDEMGKVVEVTDRDEAKGIRIRYSNDFAKHVWKKGSVTINGVSLTINEVQGLELAVWLIPETLQRTNLRTVRVGDFLTLEADMMSRFWLRQKELGNEQDI